MNYEAIETEIVNKLAENTDLTDIANVRVLPDSVADYKPPVIKGLVTVCFLGEKADSNQSIGQSSQHTTLTFNVSVQSKLLRGGKGVYLISEEVKRSLEGFQPSDCGILTLSDHEFNGYQNDIWEHSITFSCRSLRTQEYANSLPFDAVTNDEVYYQKNTVNENISV